jgi:hypothetical protein
MADRPFGQAPAPGCTRRLGPRRPAGGDRERAGVDEPRDHLRPRPARRARPRRARRRLHPAVRAGGRRPAAQGLRRQDHRHQAALRQLQDRHPRPDPRCPAHRRRCASASARDSVPAEVCLAAWKPPIACDNSALLGAGKPRTLISMLCARCSSTATSGQVPVARTLAARSRWSSQRSASSSDWTLGRSAMAAPPVSNTGISRTSRRFMPRMVAAASGPVCPGSALGYAQAASGCRSAAYQWGASHFFFQPDTP